MFDIFCVLKTFRNSESVNLIYYKFGMVEVLKKILLKTLALEMHSMELQTYRWTYCFVA